LSSRRKATGSVLSFRRILNPSLISAQIPIFSPFLS
jgi:hypothetical protein